MRHRFLYLHVYKMLFSVVCMASHYAVGSDDCKFWVRDRVKINFGRSNLNSAELNVTASAVDTCFGDKRPDIVCDSIDIRLQAGSSQTPSFLNLVYSEEIAFKPPVRIKWNAHTDVIILDHYKIHMPRIYGQHVLHVLPHFNNLILNKDQEFQHYTIFINVSHCDSHLFYICLSVLAVMLTLYLFTHKRLRFHLSTLVLVLLTSAILIWVNSVETYDNYMEISSRYVSTISMDARPGWPLQLMQINATMTDWEFSFKALALDTYVFVQTLVIVAALSEVFFRTRTKRKVTNSRVD